MRLKLRLKKFIEPFRRSILACALKALLAATMEMQYKGLMLCLNDIDLVKCSAMIFRASKIFLVVLTD